MPGENTSLAADFNFGDTMSEVLPAIREELSGDEPSAPEPSPASEPSAPESAPVAAPEPSPAPEPAPAPALEHPYPKSWKKGFEEVWTKADPAIRAEIARREEDFHRGFQPYRALADKVRDALEPISPLVQSGKADPFQIFRAFGTYHAALSNPQTAVPALKQLMQDYGITPEHLTAEAPYVHPEVAALQQQLEGVNSRLSERESREQQAAQAALRSQIEVFAADPQNEHFNEVAGEMATLLQANPKLTLKEAYDKAVRLNDSVWAKVQQKQAADKAAQEAAEAKKKAEEAAAAERASVGSVRNRARTVPVTGAVGSMDDTMRETLAAMKNRDR